VAVAAFFAGQIRFLDIVDTVAAVLAKHDGVSAAEISLEAVEAAETWARAEAAKITRYSGLG
jgi:1-deoxy-D-xylulose-5-phosphate reductoisomerase